MADAESDTTTSLLLSGELCAPPAARASTVSIEPGKTSTPYKRPFPKTPPSLFFTLKLISNEGYPVSMQTHAWDPHFLSIVFLTCMTDS